MSGPPKAAFQDHETYCDYDHINNKIATAKKNNESEVYIEVFNRKSASDIAEHLNRAGYKCVNIDGLLNISWKVPFKFNLFLAILPLIIVFVVPLYFFGMTWIMFIGIFMSIAAAYGLLWWCVLGLAHISERFAK